MRRNLDAMPYNTVTESVLHERDFKVHRYNALRDDLFTDSLRAIRYYVRRNKQTLGTDLIPHAQEITILERYLGINTTQLQDNHFWAVSRN